MSRLPGPHEDDRYASLEDGAPYELKVKGSLFLAQARRVDHEADARVALAEVRRRLHDATHHCWAWRLGPPESLAERSEDDGEPSGSAGLPILGALRSGRFFDALIIVTRYFGGTKLGTGGLVRAYGEAARGAIERARERIVWRESTLVVTCGYEQLGAVEAILARESRHLRRTERQFREAAQVRVTVLASQVLALETELVEATSGRARLERVSGG